MEIAFCSQELRALCESAKAIRNKFGTEAAEALMTLLSELRAAESVDDLIETNVSAVLNDAKSIYLSAMPGVRLKVEANHAKVPTMKDGSIAWDQVYRLKIMEIKNGG